MVKENTESKSEEKEINQTKRSVTTRIRILERSCDHTRSKRVRRTIKWHIGIVVFIFAIAILQGALSGKWGEPILVSIIAAIWLGLVTILEIENHNKQWTIHMLSGLLKIEREEIDTLMDSLSKAPSVTVVKQPRKSKKET